MPSSSKNRDAIKAAKAISGISNTLKALGIKGAFCSPADAATAISEKVKKLIEDTWSSFISLIKSIGGDTLMSLVVLLGALVGGVLSAAIATIFGDLIMGNIVGGIFGAVCAILAAIAGIEIIFQYLAIKTLKNELGLRVRLTHLMVSDIDTIITTLTLFLNLFKSLKNKSDEVLSKELTLIVSKIDKALFYLHIEESRISGDPSSVLQVGNIKIAQKYIEEAIDILTGGTSGELKRKLQAHSQKSLSKNKHALGNPLDKGWVDSLKDMAQGINEDFFKINEPYGTPAYERAKKEKIAKYKTFLEGVLPMMPDILKALLVSQTLTDPSMRLMTKFPVGLFGSLADYLGKDDATVGMGQITGWYKKALAPSNRFVELVTGQTVNKNVNQDSFFTDEVTKNLTLDDLRQSVKIFELIILVFPKIWGTIKLMGKLYQGYISLAIKKLNTVKTDIENKKEEFKKEQDGLSKVMSITKNKLSWVMDLELANSFLKPMVSKNLELGVEGSTVSPIEVADLVEKAGKSIDKLKIFITKKSMDKDGNPLVDPLSVAMEQAQDVMIPLMTNTLLLLNKNAMQSTIGKLQTIKISLNKQLEIDNMEMNLCTSTIVTIESHPAFKKLKEIFDVLMGQITKLPGGDLFRQLDSGNILGLASAGVGAYDAVSDIIDLFECKPDAGPKPGTLDKLFQYVKFTGIDPPPVAELQEIQANVDTTVNSLKTKSIIVETMTASISKALQASVEQDIKDIETINASKKPNYADIGRLRAEYNRIKEDM